MELIINKRKVFIATGGKEFDVNKPALIMLHGAGMDHTVWSMQARYFAHHGFSVLNPDLPGHGRSDGLPPASIPEYANWVLGLISELGGHEIHLIGHSMGSLIALASSASLGEKVVKQALLGVLPHIQVHPNLLGAAQKNEHSAYETVVGWGVGSKAQIGGNKAPGAWVSGTSMRLLEASKPGVLGNDLNACNNWEEGLEACSNVLCPTLLLLGSNDKMTPPKGTKIMSETLRESTTITLPDAGHMMMVEQPEQTLDALISFFEN